MRKKWNIVVYRTIISILLLFNTMFFQIINTTVLAAGTAIDAKITQLQLLTDSGTPATAVAKSATIRIEFNFEIPSTILNKDDYFDIAIPKELDLTTAVTNPITFDITDEGGTIVAKATIYHQLLHLQRPEEVQYVLHLMKMHMENTILKDTYTLIQK